MKLRFFSVVFVFCALAMNTQALLAQTTPRRVYWLHDINEDNIDASLTTPKSSFWLNYAGTSRTAEEECATQGEGYFRSTYPGMNPKILSYYTDRPIPKGNYSIFLSNGTSLIRTKINDSESATATRMKIQASMDAADPEISKPFIIAQGAGAALAMDINRNDGSNGLIGGIISVGGANQGIPLINGVSTGKLSDFDKYMKKTFLAGHEKYASKVEAKIFTTVIGLGFGFIGAGETVSATIAESIKEILKKLFEKALVKLSGFALGEFAKAGITFEGALERNFKDLYPELDDILPPNDPKIFNAYIKSAYSKSNRPLLGDLEPISPWMQNNQTNVPTIPVVSINGRNEKASYFQVMQTARWKVHTKNRCLDLKVEQMVPLVTNAPTPILVKRTVDITKDHENLGADSQEAYNEAFLQQAAAFKSSYIAVSAICESAKFIQTVALGSKDPIVTPIISAVVGLSFGIVGMIQADQTGDEIKASFEKGAKWVKNESDPEWARVIGATKDTTCMGSKDYTQKMG